SCRQPAVDPGPLVRPFAQFRVLAPRRGQTVVPLTHGPPVFQVRTCPLPGFDDLCSHRVGVVCGCCRHRRRLLVPRRQFGRIPRSLGPRRLGQTPRGVTHTLLGRFHLPPHLGGVTAEPLLHVSEHPCVEDPLQRLTPL